MIKQLIKKGLGKLRMWGEFILKIILKFFIFLILKFLSIYKYITNIIRKSYKKISCKK
jgi:hypothetical protein